MNNSKPHEKLVKLWLNEMWIHSLISALCCWLSNSTPPPFSSVPISFHYYSSSSWMLFMVRKLVRADCQLFDCSASCHSSARWTARSYHYSLTFAEESRKLTVTSRNSSINIEEKEHQMKNEKSHCIMNLWTCFCLLCESLLFGRGSLSYFLQ